MLESIRCHEQSWYNLSCFTRRHYRQLAHQLKETQARKDEVAHYRAQLDRAKSLGKERFDRARFRVKSDKPLPYESDYWATCGLCKKHRTCVRVSADVYDANQVANVQFCYDCLLELASKIIPFF